ncbi:MAG: endolytic transglycosylase MltG [Steroidobacteraceae bacterium]
MTRAGSRRLLALLAMLVAAGVAIAALVVQRWLDAPLPINGPEIRIDVPRGEAFSRTADSLGQRGLVDHPRWLAAYARLTGADARIRAGEYDVPAGSTPRSLVALMQSGKVVRRAVTVVEGWTFHDLRRALERAPGLLQTLAGRSDAEVMSALGEPDQLPEGLFFPDTYLYEKGTTDLALLGEARKRMQRELASAWAGRTPDLPIETPYEALILASIVEKETALASERPRIAGVFTERLRLGMRLQTDPAVIYGLGADYDGDLRKADLLRDGPYNTYTRAGLPPTPIALPGAAALAAAVRPDERDELYFVASGLPDGSHVFSRTLAEHERAVAGYLKRYRQQDAKQR